MAALKNNLYLARGRFYTGGGDWDGIRSKHYGERCIVKATSVGACREKLYNYLKK
jgi:hypothetical protein